MFTVFSWNLQRLTSLSERAKHVARIIDMYKPDIMFVSEVSHDTSFDGYLEIGHALSLNISKTMGNEYLSNQLSTKLFVRRSTQGKFMGRSIRVLREAGEQPRAMIKATFQYKDNLYTFRFIHSKAAHKSAGNALQKIKSIMKEEGRSAVLGDMNFAINKEADLSEAKNFDQKVYQMKDEFGSPVSNTHSAGKKLDYMVANSLMRVRVHKAKIDTMKYRRPFARVPGNIVRLSDHRPIMYTVS